MSEMNPIYKIYQNQLQRIPDPDGLRHYQAQMAGGRTLEDIRREIANSPEAKNRGVGAFAPVPTYTAIPPKDYMDRSRPSFMQEGVPREVEVTLKDEMLSVLQKKHVAICLKMDT